LHHTLSQASSGILWIVEHRATNNHFAFKITPILDSADKSSLPGIATGEATKSIFVIPPCDSFLEKGNCYQIVPIDQQVSLYNPIDHIFSLSPDERDKVYSPSLFSVFHLFVFLMICFILYLLQGRFLLLGTSVSRSL
jgi:hypothetical protein